MVTEIIKKLKKRIRVMWIVIGALVALLAVSSAYNVYFVNTFESAGTYYTVPDKQKIPYFPQSDKRRKKVK